MNHEPNVPLVIELKAIFTSRFKDANVFQSRQIVLRKARPFSPNLTASSTIFICRSISNARTIVEALGPTIDRTHIEQFGYGV
ncbi:hypothetical protein L484_000331 [Morus notabilis]|uniref:Uncharacterized protein n=1 Tax=Morus notabilis TaxID=981085 RepID=W9R6F0_9ROSA|nr:hypothetical protein L484_026186 [Morus notabilis]EXC38414.1 hypothetical protein L484_000331 [Morus notabilis]